MLHKFGTMLGGEMHSFFDNISKWKAELEGQVSEEETSLSIPEFVDALDL